MNLNLEFLKRIFRKLPPAIRCRCSSILWDMVDWYSKNLNPLYPRVWIFKGTSKNNGTPLAFAYAGMNVSSQEYWAQSVLAPNYQRTSPQRFLFWNILPFLKKHPHDCHFVTVEENWLTRKFFSRNPGFQIPHWLDMEIDISKPFTELFGNVRVDIERRIRKFQLTYEITRDLRYFDEFYYRMYVPYAQKRHTRTAVIASYAAVLKMFTQGELILIKKEEEILCAGLFECTDRTVKFRKLGVTDGDWKHVRNGVIGACYYFTIRELKQRGYTKVNIGGTRPLLSDGVTKFKMSLNARPSPMCSGSSVRLMFLHNSPGLQDFLINNSLIFLLGNSLKQAIFIHAQKPYSPERFKPCEGIAGTQLFVFSETKTWNEDLQSLSKNNCVIRSADTLFLQRSKEPNEYSYHFWQLECRPDRYGKPGQMRT